MTPTGRGPSGRVAPWPPGPGDVDAADAPALPPPRRPRSGPIRPTGGRIAATVPRPAAVPPGPAAPPSRVPSARRRPPGEGPLPPSPRLPDATETTDVLPGAVPGPDTPVGAPSEEEAPPGSGLDTALVETADADVAEGWALVRATQDGDGEAFGRLFDRYHDVVFRFVLYRLGDRSLAEDLTQETFVRALRRISSVSYQGRDIGAWFVTIARNLVLDHVKSSRYRLETAIGEVTEVVGDSSRPGPEHEVVAGATHAELMRCVARLGDDQRECISLRFLQGLSVAETAVIMERNEGAVKALQHRAIRRLAQLVPEGLR